MGSDTFEMSLANQPVVVEGKAVDAALSQCIEMGA